MLEKRISFDHSVTENGHIQVRKIIRIIEDGTVLSRTYQRHVLAPGQSTEGQDERTIAIANTIWTSDVKKKWKAEKEKNK